MPYWFALKKVFKEEQTLPRSASLCPRAAQCSAVQLVPPDPWPVMTHHPRPRAKETIWQRGRMDRRGEGSRGREGPGERGITQRGTNSN